MVSKKNLKKNKISECLYTSTTKSLCPFQSSSDHSSSDKSTCPVKCTVQPGSNIYPNYNFWPSQIDLRILQQNNSLSNPMDKDFDYVKEFNSLNLQAVKKDLAVVMTNSQDWWPADYGTYAPFMVRMA